MKALLRRATYGALAATRLPPLVHRMGPGRLTVLMYHAVTTSPLTVPDWSFLDANVLRAQAEYLGRHFQVLPLSEAAALLRAGRIRRPTVSITFDDGFQSVHDVAWPILQRLGLPATVFLVTGLVGTDQTLWFCRLNRALASARRSGFEWRGHRFDFGTAAGRGLAGAVLQRRLKELPQPMLLHELQAVVGALGDDPERPVGLGSPYRIMGRAEVKALAGSGTFEVGAHSERHATLSMLPAQEREDEVERSLAAVATLTGEPCRLFSYPNGGPADIDHELTRLLAARGVEAAVTGIAGANKPTTPALELRRYGVGSDTTGSEFELMVHHALPRRERRRTGLA